MFTTEDKPKPNSYFIKPNQTTEFNPQEFFDRLEEEKEDDWRNE
jgi:hypothetical protein